MWSMVEAGLTAGEIAAAILARYEGDRADVAGGVAAFLQELQTEELIVPIEPGVVGSPARAEPASGEASARLPYQPPVLNKYTDMKDMLLLDPIHDVEETGWPTPKAGS
jgi:Coenzyme PQQ synthesis protein D (PqqD)